MVNAVEQRRRSSDQIIDTIYDDHLKEMEKNSPQALSLVRRLLKDSSVFPMPFSQTHGKPIQPVA